MREEPLTTPTPGESYLVTGVRWLDRTPRLAARELATGTGLLLDLTAADVSFVVRQGTKSCLGYMVASAEGALSMVPCPESAPADRRESCAACAQRDVFRHAHTAHHGGSVPEGLAKYLAAPHRLYVATFADGTSKVGTAASVRGHARLDEQGAAAATYVCDCPDGLSVRHLEDLVSKTLRLSQFKRKASKYASVARPRPLESVKADHSQCVADVRQLVAQVAKRHDSTPCHEWWPLPELSRGVFTPTSSAGWAAYPLEFTSGSHTLRVVGCAGPYATVTTAVEGGALSLVDLDELKGLLVSFDQDDASTGETYATQGALF